MAKYIVKMKFETIEPSYLSHEDGVVFEVDISKARRFDSHELAASHMVSKLGSRWGDIYHDLAGHQQQMVIESLNE